MGVSSKQTDRARQSFQRSAEQAGFFAHGRDRLIEPNVDKLPAAPRAPEGPTGGDAKIPRVMHSGGLRPEVTDLLATLLTDGADWSAEKVAEFVSTARKLNELLAGE